MAQPKVVIPMADYGHDPTGMRYAFRYLCDSTRLESSIVPRYWISLPYPMEVLFVHVLIFS
jgi:hypothetical protein